MWRPQPILLSALLLTTAALATPACASQGGFYRYPVGIRVDQRAYDRGYSDGRDRGEQDARRQRGFDYSRHHEYRDADAGYRGYGDRDEYRRVFRQGFIAGYNDGYRRDARDGYGYGRPGRYPDVNPGRSPDYPGYPGGYASPASASGYRDGYDQGMDDARHRRRFDPVAASRYREGDHDYDRRYGSRDAYKRDYRTAFQQGYEQGYRGFRG